MPRLSIDLAGLSLGPLLRPFHIGVAITAQPGALDIAVKNKMLEAIDDKHGPAMNQYWKEEFGYDISKLTQGEAGHLKAASSVDAIRDRVSAARDAHRLRIHESRTTEEKGAESRFQEEGLKPQPGPYKEKAEDFRHLSTKDLMEKYPDDEAILGAVTIQELSKKYAARLSDESVKKPFVEGTINKLAYNIEHGLENKPPHIKEKQSNNDLEH